MGLLRYFLNIPILILLVWLLFDAKPSENGIEFSFLPQDYIKTVPALFMFFIFGYVFARVDAWFSYAPLRRSLRLQQRENRALNKEHVKLHETVDNLKHNIEGLKEKNNAIAVPNGENTPKASAFSRFKNKVFSKKG